MRVAVGNSRGLLLGRLAVQHRRPFWGGAEASSLSKDGEMEGCCINLNPPIPALHLILLLSFLDCLLERGIFAPIKEEKESLYLSL